MTVCELLEHVGCAERETALGLGACEEEGKKQETQGGVGMATTYLHAVASLDGFIADERDEVGPLHDWYFRTSGRSLTAT
jgi:hypothetical protein